MPATQLSWTPGFSLSRRPAKRPTARRIRPGVSANGDRTQRFDFILEHPVNKSCTPNDDRANGQVDVTAHTKSQGDKACSDFKGASLAGNDNCACLETAHALNGLPQYACSGEETGVALRISRDSTDRKQLLASLNGDVGFSISEETSIRLSTMGPDSMAMWEPSSLPNVPSASIPPGILYSSLSRRFQPILDRCTPSLQFDRPIAFH